MIAPVESPAGTAPCGDSAIRLTTRRQPALLLFLIGTACFAAGPLSAQSTTAQPPTWDVTAVRGTPRVIDFTMDEGTWMSLAITPDAKTLLFDLLGHIYRMPVSGGETTCLTCDSGIAVNYHPRVSPDGRRVAFISDRNGQDNLWIMQADGSHPAPVLLDMHSRFAEPAWLDDQTLIVTRKLNTSWGIYLRNDTLWTIPLGGGQPTQLVPDTIPDFTPGEFTGSDRAQWPTVDRVNGWVYFSKNTFKGDDWQLRRFNLATRAVQSITESKELHLPLGAHAEPVALGEAAPEVSPDGRLLAFIRRIPGAYLQVGEHRISGRSALWIRDIETGTDRILMDPITYDGMAMEPQWQMRVAPGYEWFPDGRSLLISQGGKIRRVWLDGRVETIPFRVHVQRRISEQVRAKVRIEDRSYAPRLIRTAHTSPDGKNILFEAIGQLWRKSLKAGSSHPVPLTDCGHRVFERYPAWSNDGRSLVFVASDGLGASALWRYDQTGRLKKLTQKTAEYVRPFFSADGRHIFASRWPRALTRIPAREPAFRPVPLDNQYWQLVRLPAAGGEPIVVADTGVPVDIGLGPQGRIFFTESGQDSPATPTRLVSMTQDGKDRRTEAQVLGRVDALAPSPDGAWLAIHKWGDIYLARRDDPTHVWNILADDRNLQRLSTQGGSFPRWRDHDRLEYTSAQTLVTYDVRTKESTEQAIDLSVPRAGGKGHLLFKNARIVTLGAGRMIERGDLLVNDHRIACIGTCDSKGAHVIDASGRTLIPGWIDMHAHQLSDDDFYLPMKRASSSATLAYGVTTIHDPLTQPDASYGIRDLIEADRMVGPRSYLTGFAIQCSAPGYEDNRPIRTFEDADNEVARRVRMGSTTVKDYRVCTRQQRQWILESARRHGVTVTYEGGEPEFLLGEIMSGAPGWEHAIQLNPAYRDLTQFMGQANTHFSQQFMLTDFPFGIAIRYFEGQQDLWKDEKLARFTPWQPHAMLRVFGHKPLEEYSFPIQAAWAHDMVRAGGYVPLGSHSVVNGLGMHWEVWAYAAGATPEAALTAASLHGAHFLGLEAELGTLEVGKLADIVVLRANPLEDIRNTLAIESVMKAGVLYDGDTLDEIWPRTRRYGERPWTLQDIRRFDTRKD